MEESERPTAVCPWTGSVEAWPPAHSPLSSTAHPCPPHHHHHPASTTTSPPCCCCWEKPSHTHTVSLSRCIHACLLSPKYTRWKTADVNCRTPPSCCYGCIFCPDCLFLPFYFLARHTVKVKVRGDDHLAKAFCRSQRLLGPTVAS